MSGSFIAGMLVAYALVAVGIVAYALIYHRLERVFGRADSGGPSTTWELRGRELVVTNEYLPPKTIQEAVDAAKGKPELRLPICELSDCEYRVVGQHYHSVTYLTEDVDEPQPTGWQHYRCPNCGTTWHEPPGSKLGELHALADKWDVDAEVIEQATHGGERGTKPLPKVRKGIAAEALRAAARDLRRLLQEVDA